MYLRKIKQSLFNNCGLITLPRGSPNCRESHIRSKNMFAFIPSIWFSQEFITLFVSFILQSIPIAREMGIILQSILTLECIQKCEKIAK